MAAAETDNISAIGEFLGDMGTFMTFDFGKAFLLATQQNSKNDQSECLSTFGDYQALYVNMNSMAQNSTSYYEGLKAKGQGDGTSVGFSTSNLQGYVDVFIGSVNVYNYCDIDYYTRSVSRWFSLQGTLNLGVNLVFRIYSTDDKELYKNLSSAVASKDQAKAGTAFGSFVSLLLMFEIPDQTTTASYVNVDSLMPN